MVWAIQYLRTTAGFLERCPLEFTPGLTCIIGARGTCKSTIVETIRFVFDCEPDKVKVLTSPSVNGPAAIAAPRTGLVSTTLSGGVARCGVTDQHETATFSVERNLQGDPRVFKDGVRQIDGADVTRRVEIFSQGDLQEIAGSSDRRLALIDRPNQRRTDELKDRRKAVAEQLKATGRPIRNGRGEIESREALVKGYDAYERELAALRAGRPQMPPELEAEQAGHADRRRILGRLRAAADAHRRAAAAAAAVRAEEVELAAAVALATSVGLGPTDRVAAELAAVVAAAAAAPVVDVAVGGAARQARLDEAIRDTATEFERLDARFYELRKGQQAANESLKREEALGQELLKMADVRDELERLRTEQEAALARRAMLRAELDQIGDELYALRAGQVEAINAQFGDQVVLTLHQGTVSDAHFEQVKLLLKDSALRKQAEVARDLATRVRPADLIDIVEGGDARRLADLLQRDLGQMTRLVSHLLDADDLYGLEAAVPDDALEITMFVRGEPRPLGQLSGGQMATALLPLILREADYPLIVDQPEDDLDNAFVSEKLIGRIRELKRTRQLIFVTHNANVPVLGDAERVIVMEMDGPSRATAARAGTVEEMKGDVIRILEGGKEAFNQRQVRYGKALA